MTSQDRWTRGLESAGRGIGFQAVGFAAVGCLSAAALYVFAGSDHWTFQALELCATKLYWAFVAPLAAIFDGVRKMFETRGEIRRRMFDDGFRSGRAEAEREMFDRMERAGLPREVIEGIVSDRNGGASPNGGNGGIDPQVKRYIDERLEELGRDGD